MCGICGIINLRDNPPPESELILRMLRSLRHRGPDSSGYYRDKSAVLGHTRLAIIDLKTGMQPLSNENESLWIVFNGEIYNYRELRNELIEKGHRFKTESDTEVIVHAWEEWSEDCFIRFNGQWAIALWDVKRRELILSRDPFGIRPLYYTISNHRLIFGSEIKAIFCDDSIKRAFDPIGLAEIFTFWSTNAPVTAYKNIIEVPPGCFSVVKDGILKTRAYWSISFSSNFEKSIEEYKSELKENLVNATKLRFTRSDVPVGAYISGGIDSSVTAAIISRYTNASFDTFSLRFQDSEFNEGKYQQIMANALGTKHHSIDVSYDDIGHIFPDVIKSAERPILRTSPAPLFLLSRLVKNSGYKVVVTGEGADEVLGGYDIFRESKVRRFIAEQPESSEIKNMLEQLYPWMKRTAGQVPSFKRAFYSKDLDLNDPFFSHRPRWNSTKMIINMFSTEFKELVNSDMAINKLSEKIPSGFMNLDPLCRDQWLEYTTLLSGYILSAQGDRMLMANSIEGRFPFLDPNVVKFTNNLPSSVKLKDLNEKILLKEAFSDMIPESIIRRPKQPYRSPGAQSFFFKNKKLEWIEEVTSESILKVSGIFNPIIVKSLFKKCINNIDSQMSNSDNMRVVGLLSTMLCYKYFIQKTDSWQVEKFKPEIVIDRV